MKLEELEAKIEKILSKERYYHSKCVMKKCEELALIYGADVDKARKIGIAHDIAKEMTNEEKIKYIENNNIAIDEIEKRNMSLLHSKIGKHILIKDFDFDEEMGEAVATHTTGKENMTILDKILYIADGIGEDSIYEEKDYIADLAKTDVDEAVIRRIEKVIERNFKKGVEIHLRSILARNYLLINKK